MLAQKHAAAGKIFDLSITVNLAVGQLTSTNGGISKYSCDTSININQMVFRRCSSKIGQLIQLFAMFI